MAAELTLLCLGWGWQSTALLQMQIHRQCGCALCERFGVSELPLFDYAINSDTTWESEGTYAYAAEWTPWAEARGIKMLRVTPKRPEVVRQHKSGHPSCAVPAFHAHEGGDGAGKTHRQCTGDWKIDPQDQEMRRIMRRLKIPKKPNAVAKIIGISMDEWQRMKPSKLSYVTHIYPLVERRIARADCARWLKEHDIPLPPKSACVFCPFHSKTAWQELKRRGGRDWEIAVEIDRQIRDVRTGEHVSKPGQLFLHPALKPLEEAVIIPEDFGFEQIALLPVEDDELATCDSGHCFL